MRMTLEHNLNITSGQRGQNVRAYRYCEFSEFYLPKIKPMPCRGITASIWHKKQNAENVEHRASWVRNSNRLEVRKPYFCFTYFEIFCHFFWVQCGVGSFADYIVYSVDISKTLPLFDVMKTDLLNILNWHHTGRGALVCSIMFHYVPLCSIIYFSDTLLCWQSGQNLSASGTACMCLLILWITQNKYLTRPI